MLGGGSIGSGLGRVEAGVSVWCQGRTGCPEVGDRGSPELDSQGREGQTKGLLGALGREGNRVKGLLQFSVVRNMG